MGEEARCWARTGLEVPVPDPDPVLDLGIGPCCDLGPAFQDMRATREREEEDEREGEEDGGDEVEEFGMNRVDMR